MLAHAFTNMGLHRIGLAVFAFNERAIRSYEKVGFVVEGRARDAIYRDGRYWDEIDMSLLESEWRATQGLDGRGTSPVQVASQSTSSAASGSGGR
ncbi:MAG: hypothetical protein QOE66_2039, partial [Chloroflexota bacterium]|nr:hypothetical protein [Chloroflexota bacterium]